MSNYAIIYLMTLFAPNKAKKCVFWKVSMLIFGNKVVNRIKNSSVLSAVLMNLGLLILVFVFCDLKYEVSDDFIMASILSGAFGEARNPHMIFANVLLGYLLLPLYGLLPQVSWYFVFQIFLVFASSVAITWMLLEKTDKIKAVMISTILLLFFSVDAYILVQFTKTAMFAVTSGSLLFLWGVFRERGLRTLLTGGVLCLLGTMLRFEVIYMAGAFILLILAYEFVRLYKAGDKKKLGKRFLKIAAFGVGLIALVLLVEEIDHRGYDNKKYRYFAEYGSARAGIVDYAEYGYQSYAEQLEAVDVSEVDYCMLKAWSFADNEVFTLDKMRATADTIKRFQDNLPLGKEQVLERLVDRGVQQYPVFFACLLLLVCGVFLNWERWWLVLCSDIIAAAYMLYFVLRDRMLYRTEFSFFLGAFLCGAYFWERGRAKDAGGQEPGREGDDRRAARRACTVITVALWAVSTILYVPNRSYLDVDENSRRSYIEGAFYESWNYDAKKYRKVVNKGKRCAGLLAELGNKNHFYFGDFTTTIQVLYFEWSPWKALPPGYFDNYAYLGGVTTNFPDVKETLERWDISVPLRDLVNDDVYLIDNVHVELKLQYLREHYYPDARAELYKEVDGYQIWKFYKE